jgi:hypothetical protein
MEGEVDILSSESAATCPDVASPLEIAADRGEGGTS